MNRPTTVPNIEPYAAEDRRAADHDGGDHVQVGLGLAGDGGGAELGQGQHRRRSRRAARTARRSMIRCRSTLTPTRRAASSLEPIA